MCSLNEVSFHFSCASFCSVGVNVSLCFFRSILIFWRMILACRNFALNRTAAFQINKVSHFSVNYKLIQFIRTKAIPMKIHRTMPTTRAHKMKIHTLTKSLTFATLSSLTEEVAYLYAHYKRQFNFKSNK